MSEASAEAAVASAQLAVRNAEDAVSATALRAPAAATVAAVNGAVGDAVTAGGGGASPSSSASSSSSSASSSGFITLTQLSRMHLEVSLSESDINHVAVGQPATVSVNAASGEEVAGKVIAIGVLAFSASSSSGSASAVSYPVTIALTQTTKGLRPGMSATAEIVTGQASGVVVPNQALRGSTVTVIDGGKRTTQQVQTGVAGDTSTQVLSGLRAGQQVVVTSPSATAGANATSGSGTGAGVTGAGGGRAGGFGGARRGFGGTGLGGGLTGGGGAPGGLAAGGGR